ncbi:MAG: 1-deoxy-D-xylulose-5-phosphate synthase [Clostridiales Family XIII bacterium]|jgi:1-deoxy-D-xylulose-5-phosphate synthase|nr:1-deoxy-D-xylulose-5-phosphate synthase [Clostridiales Family XIII bacterium]
MTKKNLTEYDFPKELKGMTANELDLLTYEIRDFLIDMVSKTGGHLAPNLGVVELTIALHRVFNIPKDKIVWDVGHQAYIHKILTGRASQFHTLRKKDGLSGFPKRDESDADVFDSGHASTSISAAMGLAEARDIRGGKEHVIAVIGDGAMTGGAAFEGINNAGIRQTRLIVVLNDNEMSISHNIGSLSQHLRRLRISKTYQNAKDTVKKNIIKIPAFGDTLYRGLGHTKDLIHYAVISECIFEALGFDYYGPVDGHDLPQLLRVFETSKRFEKPTLIHVVTKKGKGYRNAELNPQKFHGINAFDPETGLEIHASKGASYSKIAGEKLLQLAEADENITAITAAMMDGTGLGGFAKRFPNRFFDVGIAEQHAVTFAAGLALGGRKPFVCIYSSFLQRAYDQLLIDISMQKLPVVFLIDRAGNVGPDGETHHGVFDLSYLSTLPNFLVLAPSDGEELRKMITFAAGYCEGPVAIRYPRGEASPVVAMGGKSAVNDGDAVQETEMRSRVLKRGKDAEIWTVGPMASMGIEASKLLKKENISVKVVDARCVKPFDTVALKNVAKRGVPILTLEDNVRAGGFGSQVQTFFMQNNYKNAVYTLAWPDEFVPQGATPEMMREYGLTAENVAEQIKRLLK